MNIEISPSELEPGWDNVLIRGNTQESVQSAIFNLDEEYSAIDFRHPYRVKTGGWMAMGRCKR